MSVDYTYIVARLNAVEASMPEDSWFDRLSRVEAGSIQSSLKEYFRGFEHAESIRQFEKVLETEKLEGLDLVSKLISSRDVSIFLRGGYDFDNMLYLWKANLLGGENESREWERLVPFGLIPPEKIREAIVSETVTYLPFYIKEIFERLSGITDETQMLMAQSLCESAKWQCMLDMAPSSYARFVTRCRIDLENIKSLIRSKRTDLRKSGQDHLWIDGGEIERLTLERLFQEPEDELYLYLNTSRYKWLTDHGLDSETDLWKIDPLMLRQLFNIMLDSRYRYFDIGPVICHLEIRERNIMLLRLIITGKINHLPDNDILEMVESILSS